jgi:cysteinyl-tRNA synthetase
MSNIQVFNTLTGKKESFTPSPGNRVTMYACGPTVYDLSHLGHARMSIVWDVVQRYLRFSGFDVTYVRNITDVDDKIIKKADELGTTPERVAREFTYTFWNDMHALNVEPPDYEPRATEFIDRMIKFTEDLIAAGHAYASGSDVYFDVSSFSQYGKLSKKKIDDLLVGAREQVHSQEELAERKKSPVDFALWKGTTDDKLGWQSPWGRGRPGWHLECSTMTRHVLGETIDIHAGGEDLVFPHHENEIAQSESLHGKPMARYWLHNSFVQVSSEKMSKSLGNFSTIADLLTKFSGDTIRLFALGTTYGKPIDFTIESLTGAQTVMSRFLRAASYATPSNGDGGSPGYEAGGAKSWSSMGAAMISSVDRLTLANAEARDPVNDEVTKTFRKEFVEAMDNDFNTAIAISLLHGLSDKIFSESDGQKQIGYATVFIQYAKLLGLTLNDTRRHVDSKTGSEVLDLVLDLRQSARSKKDYETSDQIRKKLTELGISVMDTTGGGAAWELT